MIYDHDGDGVINTKDLTLVLSATMREQDIVIHKGAYIFSDSLIFFLDFPIFFLYSLNDSPFLLNKSCLFSHLHSTLFFSLELLFLFRSFFSLFLLFKSPLNWSLSSLSLPLRGCGSDSRTNYEGSQPS